VELRFPLNTTSRSEIVEEYLRGSPRYISASDLEFREIGKTEERIDRKIDRRIDRG